MKRLYKKSKLAFTLIWIAIYVTSFSLADKLSDTIGIQKIITAPLGLVLVLIMVSFLVKNNLTKEYGFCSFRGKSKDFLYFIPIIPVVSVNLWNGVSCSLSLLEIVLFVISMFCVGFMEELLTRGFLFKTMCENNIKSAVIVSSITFGLGHIVNLLNGADLIPTLLQVCYAAAVGFMLVAFVYKGKSIWPCIIFHGVFNSLSAFAVEGTRAREMVISAVLCVLSLGYALWIWKKTPNADVSK